MTLENEKAAVTSSGASNVHFLNPDNMKCSSIGQQSQAIRISDDPVMQSAVQKIYDQGPRYLLELLATLAENYMQANAVEKEIKHFALMPPNALRLIGSSHIQRFAPLEVPQ